MQSTRERVLSALFDRLRSVGGATVRRNETLPQTVPAPGLVILRDGEPGERDLGVYELVARAQAAAIDQLEATVDGELGLPSAPAEWIKGIEFVAHYSELGSGYGGYNEDHEFFGYRHSI